MGISSGVDSQASVHVIKPAITHTNVELQVSHTKLYFYAISKKTSAVILVCRRSTNIGGIKKHLNDLN